jgi:hypothetical protein
MDIHGVFREGRLEIAPHNSSRNSGRKATDYASLRAPVMGELPEKSGPRRMGVILFFTRACRYGTRSPSSPAMG